MVYCWTFIGNAFLSGFLILVYIVSLSGTTTGFIFTSKCLAPPPCTCSFTTINCSYKKLTQVPVFLKQNDPIYSLMTLELDNNQLTTIPAYVFKNLSAVNPTSIYLYLDNNHISNIEMHAFGGVENLITELTMENNNITHLPRALTELSSLHLLDLLRNLLVKLDASVFANFGSSLKYLFIPVDRLSTLSNELHSLTILSQLTMHGISSQMLDSTVFQGFENSLTSLDMSYAYFERIPMAVCTLKSLKSFTSNHSPNLGTYNSSIFGECNHTMTSVTSLSLQYDQLATIPKLGRIFPRLDILKLQNNAIHFIENSSLVGMTSLTELNLGNNNLTRIPFAVNSATNLHRLNVDNNQIATVGDFDLLRLYNLTLLSLMGNPIVHISPFAFTHNALLNDIDISYTNIVQVPRALLGLKHLRNVNIDNTYSKAIECSCQAMDYLKSWNVTSIKFNHVTCSSGFSVNTYYLKSYLTSDLPKCP